MTILSGYFFFSSRNPADARNIAGRNHNTLISIETRPGRQSLIPGKETQDTFLRRLGVGKVVSTEPPGRPEDTGQCYLPDQA